MQTIPPIDVNVNDLVIIHVTGDTDANRGDAIVISGVTTNRKVVEALEVLAEVFRRRAVADEMPPLPPSAPGAYDSMSADEKADFAHGFNDLPGVIGDINMHSGQADHRD